MTTELAPDFRCKDCGRPLDVSRANAEAPWEPADCYRCVMLPAQRRAVAARRALGHVVAGVDLDQALAAYRKLPPFVGNLGKVRLEVAHRMELGTRGTAFTRQRRLRVAAGPDATPERVLEVLVHEMCHLTLLNGDHHHDERFRRVFKRACQELWGIDVPLNAPASQGCIAYGMGEIATAALREKIARGGVALFPPTTKEEAPKPSRAELSAVLVERRATHAARMLARAEKRTKAAQRALTKWREKVRYYERQAARKATKPWVVVGFAGRPRGHHGADRGKQPAGMADRRRPA